MRLMRPLLLGFVALLPLVGAGAQDVPPSPIAKARLLVDAPKVSAGAPVTAVVQFTLPEHWHIYWQNPGDSGIPTTFEWTLPDGLSAGSVAWPAPERIETEGLVNYGYSDAVSFVVPLMPTRDGISGEVKLKANWLVCKDICIPESAELMAPLKGNAEASALADAAKARVPVAFTGAAHFNATAQAVTLTLTRDEGWAGLTGIRFSPVEDGIAANNPAPKASVRDTTLTLTFARGTEEAIATWHGVLHAREGDKDLAWDVAASQDGSVAAAAPVAASEGSLKREVIPPSLLLALGLALVGGLLLNIMPCVLPILALKALSLAKKAESSRLAAAKQGLSFTAGVIASFLAVAGLMLALKASGSAIGWGFQLQNPLFVGFLALVMFLVSANLFGMFELPVLFGNRATAVDENKLSGSFFTGVLSVLVATPCSAPFMATAIGATLALPTAQALLVFAALGLGMASPFLIISLWPAARHLLPKPGAWMLRFKQILGVPMLITGVWLLFVCIQLLQPVRFAANDGHVAYAPARLAQLRAEGTPVLVDATAAWCLSCKVNERVALKPDAMQQFFREKRVTLMVADWTSYDPEITAYLASFMRNGVPLYVYYPPHGEPLVLPQILTPAIVRDAINGAHD